MPPGRGRRSLAVAYPSPQGFQRLLGLSEVRSGSAGFAASRGQLGKLLHAIPVVPLQVVDDAGSELIEPLIVVLRPEAGAGRGRADSRPAGETAVPGDGQWFVIPGAAVRGVRPNAVPARTDSVPHAAAVRAVGAVPLHAQDRGGVLAAVRSSAALPGVPGRVPCASQRAIAHVSVTFRSRLLSGSCGLGRLNCDRPLVPTLRVVT